VIRYFFINPDCDTHTRLGASSKAAPKIGRQGWAALPDVPDSRKPANTGHREKVTLSRWPGKLRSRSIWRIAILFRKLLYDEIGKPLTQVK
jgi:hypothetical protein